MESFYQFFELFATFVEGAIAVSVSTSLADRKLGVKKNTLYVFFMSIIYTILITLLNKWQVFSFFTIAVAIGFTFAAIFFTTRGSLLYKLCAVMITWFFIHATDYIISYSLIMIIGKSIDISEGISLILVPGTIRMIYILINKLLQIAIFVSFHKLYSKLKLLNKKNIFLLFAVTTLSYIVMSILTNLVLTDSLISLQTAVIFSLLFIILTIVISIISVVISSKYQNEKREKELIALTNTLMEKNYTEIKHAQDIIRKQVHDFKNHILTIDGMLSEDSNAKKYTKELLETSYQQAQNCHSGNEIIDSIINCKMNEATNQNIEFNHKILLNTKLNISFVDICAILANQIDNALEACAKISIDKERSVKVQIWQKESFVFFKVINTVDKNPFDSLNNLKSTKDNSDTMHGLGIKNIRETAAKYDGFLKNNYIDGYFISLVMVSNHD